MTLTGYSDLLKRNVMLLTVSGFLTQAAPLYATTPPKIAGNPPVVEAGAIPPTPTVSPSAPQFTTVDKLNQIPLSGSVYYALRRALLEHLGSPLPETSGNGSTIVDPLRQDQAENINGTVQYNVAASNDSNQDVEPTVSTLNYSGIDWTITVGIKYVTDPIYGANTNRLCFSRARGAVPPSFTGPSPLNVPAGYRHASDPYLATNPYSAGISPQTVYLSGILHNDTTSQANAVAVWRSRDGGSSWEGPASIVQPDSSRFYDKPAIAVSYASSSLGRVFVAWVDVASGNGNFNVIKLARSCDGGATFPMVISVAGPMYAHGPQVAIDNTNGRIYVVYANHAQRRLEMATIVDGTNCTTDWPVLLATENITGPRELVVFTDRSQDQMLNRGVRAITAPVARFNFAAHRIGVAWHEREYAGATTTDAYITTKSLGVGGTWTTPTRITANSAQDQFMPALDADASGNWIVSLYNRSDDSSNTYYREYYRPFTADGLTPLANESWLSSIQYDPAWQPSNSGFLGDYQDIWEWTFVGGASRWCPAWIRTSQSDNMVSGIE